MTGRSLRRHLTRGAALALAVLGFLMLFSDLRSVAQLSSDVGGKTRIAVIMPHRDDGYWTFVANGTLYGGKQYGSLVDVKVYYPQLNYNVKQMTDLIKRQIAAKVDVIIAQGNDDADYQQALTDAWNGGARIILVDTDIAGFIPHLYIGTDNYEAGREMGRRLAELTGGTANVAVLSGQPGYGNLDARYRGLTEISQTYPNIRFMKLEYDNYDSLTALSKISQILTSNPSIDTLVCIEGTGGQAIGNNYAPENKRFKTILAFDDLEETLNGVKNGTIDGVVAQAQYQMGFMAVENIAKNPTANRDESQTIYTDIKWLTAENLEQQETSHEKN